MDITTERVDTLGISGSIVGSVHLRDGIRTPRATEAVRVARVTAGRRARRR